MCGIAGLWCPHMSRNAVSGALGPMIRSLAHRGPDHEGSWLDNELPLAFGHRRLSIVDLSPSGHQPMHSACGRYVLTYNGEIYNHPELRAELERAGNARNWRGHSDTETFLACISHFGLLGALQRAVGMFALGLWDREEQRLYLARDRFGEKPLYYGWFGGAFGFASELKALRRFPQFRNGIARDVLDLYFQFSYVPAPYSIFEQIYKLEAGCIFSASLDALSRQRPQAPAAPYDHDGLKIERYWSLEGTVSKGPLHDITDETEALQRLEQALNESIRQQSIADVPLGAFLSGGVDSSSIAALMQNQSSRKVLTYTIGFEDSEYDESGHAKAIASHLGTDHSELIVTENEAQRVIPSLPRIYCEPFADSSQIPTYLVAQLASRSVKVALSGDAGDELFGGYGRYLWTQRVWQQAGRVPVPLRRLLASMLQFVPPRLWNFAGAGVGINRLAEKTSKLAGRFDGVASADGLYSKLVTEWPEKSVVAGSNHLPTALHRAAHWVAGLPAVESRMMAWDCLTYLPDDILHKVDRAAMAVSLETRVPFLDHRVAELAWQLPLGMKIRNGQGKWALRQVLYKYVPRELIERPKMGFTLPIGKWLTGPLRDWAEALLEPRKIEAEGYLNADVIGQKWREHLSGSRDWSASLWSVLMFQAWLRADSSP